MVRIAGYVLALAIWICHLAAAQAAVVINEIMYHPVSEQTNEEYIELLNTGPASEDLSGWKFVRGISFTFPSNTVLQPGAYLVVAADYQVFRSRYPAITNVVGGWVGQLANDGETIELQDATGRVICSVHYASEGDWGQRLVGLGVEKVRSMTVSGTTAHVNLDGVWRNGDTVIISGVESPEFNGTFAIANRTGSGFDYYLNQTPSDEPSGIILCRQLTSYGHSGWGWFSPADGMGSSLELVNPLLPADTGQNWRSSLVNYGTPGRPNSVASTNVAPLLLDVKHFPLVPRSSDPVSITTRVVDEKSTGLVVTLFWRIDANPTNSWNSEPMFDDGLHNDALAGDGIYGAILNARPNNTVVEFYVRAQDAEGNARSWPAPALDASNNPIQAANALYQVDDQQSYTNSQPYYRIIMRELERIELYNLTGSADQGGNASFNGTFVAVQGADPVLRYNCGFRIRGAGTRGRRPQNLRVHIPGDRPWNGVNSFNLNSQFSHSQYAGYLFAILSGLDTEAGRLVQMRINNLDYFSLNPSFTFPCRSYIHLESTDGQYAANHWPNDPEGNVYRGQDGSHRCTLAHLGPNPNSYMDVGYSKQSNRTQNDWSDLTNLTYVLNASYASPAQYVQAVRQVADIEEWMRYFAVFTMLLSRETSLATGQGDDYSMYRGINDTRFKLLAHDFDTVLNQGDTTGGYTDSIWRMNSLSAIARIMTNNAFAPIYFRELKRLADTTFSPEAIEATLNNGLQGLVDQNVINAMRDFGINRRNYVLSQIPTNFSVNVSLSTAYGYYYTTSSSLALTGQANALDTGEVRVGANIATWTPYTGNWSGSVTLNPGVNNILIQTFGTNGVELLRTNITVYYNTFGWVDLEPAPTNNFTLSAAGGPYRINGAILISNVVMTVEPGVTIFLEAGSSISVVGTGKVNAVGTDTQRIRFTRTPGISGSWGRIHLNGASTESRFVYVDFEYGGSAGQVLRADNSSVYLDRCNFYNINAQYLNLNNSSFNIRNSVFPSVTGVELIHGVGVPPAGYAIIASNWFGGTTGLNDIIDFTGAQRPNAILQILSNVFTSASDDILDLDGTDAHIEGNIFMNVRHDAATSQADTASAISGGKDGANTSRLMIVRNIFFNCEHAALAKEGNFYWVINNTVIGCSHAAFNFDEPDRRISDGVTPGLGMYLDGNIIWNTATNFENVYVNDPVFGTTQLIVNRCILSGPDYITNGVGNLTVDPRFVNFSTNSAWYELTNNLRLRLDSPALGAGPNGVDIGALVPAGANISGLPYGVTSRTNLTLSVGGPGITDYRFSLDGGAFNPIPIPVTNALVLSNLTNGQHSLIIEGLNSAAVWTGPRSYTFNINSQLPAVRINELLAYNVEAHEWFGSYPDLIELYNDGNSQIDLGQMSITDDPLVPGKFVFTNGTIIEPNGYLVLVARKPSGSPGIHVGFGLNRNGGGVYLFDRGASGGALLDSVIYGVQAANYSIGRLPDGSWGLCHPTLGSANRRAPIGDYRQLKINEWLAARQFSIYEDYVELFNPEPAPVPLGGLFLTDNPIGWPRRNEIAPLSFIPAYGQTAFIADGQAENGANHLNFKLSGERGAIGLFGPDGQMIDQVVYGPQTPDVAQGRSPNGSSTIVALPQLTPGAGNPKPAGATNVTTISFPLLAWNSVWRYNQDEDLTGTGWYGTNYNDSGWSAGPGLLGAETNATVGTMNTVLWSPRIPAPGLSTPRLYYFRTTFRVTNNLAGFTIYARARIDDGAVIYLNGRELTRVRMNAGTVGYYTSATSTPGSGDATSDDIIPITPNDLVIGTNVLAAEVHQYGTDSSDIVWGMAIDAQQYITNIVGVEARPVLNEVLANNDGVLEPDGRTPDWVEIYNPYTNAINLAGMSLSDDLQQPQRFVFRDGTVLPPRGFLRILCDPAMPASATNTGFGLKANGGSVYLFDRWGIAGVSLLDSLTYGLQAPDFSLGRVPDGVGAWVLTSPTPQTNNVSVPLGNPNALKINEWMPNDRNGGDDWFEIFNPGAYPVAVGGLRLTDDLVNRTKFTIAPLSFIAPASNGFQVFRADNNPQAGADHVNFKLDNQAESIGIATASGVLIDSITYINPLPGVSEGRFLDGSTNIVRFASTPSPGAANYMKLENVVINEALANSSAPWEDAIELFNLADSPLNIGGWYISNAKRDPKRFRIPPNTRIPAHGYMVFYEYQFNPSGNGMPPDFSLDGLRGDEIYLSEADVAGNLTGYRSEVVFEPLPNGISVGRYKTSVGFDFTPLSRPTFGVDNPANVTEFRSGNGDTNAYPLIGPVVISEIMYHPPPTGPDDNTQDEYIELWNISSGPVSFFDSTHPTNTWRLRGGVDFDFPTGFVLPAGESVLLVSFDPSTNAPARAGFLARYALPDTVTILGPYRGKLDNGGAELRLLRPEAPLPDGLPNAGWVPYVQVDRVRYSDDAPWPTLADTGISWVSLSRVTLSGYGNDPINWVASFPTPSAANAGPLEPLPTISSISSNQIVAIGGTVVLSVVASDSGPVRYQWNFNGEPLPSATNATLTITNAQGSQSGVYNVLVSGPAGMIASPPVVVLVETPPQIFQQPRSLAVALGGVAEFFVSASGSSLNYQWRHNQTPLPGATNAVFMLNNVQMSDAGPYDVVVSNTLGATTSMVAFLTVVVPPSIVSSPQSQAVRAGSLLTLSVQASGTPPFHYQWYFQGEAIPAANEDSLTILSATTNFAGDYFVTVSNLAGVATSAVASVFVIVPPTVSVLANGPRDVEPGTDSGFFTIYRSGPATNDLIVHIAISGTATPGIDYESISNIVTIPAGLASVDIFINVLDDNLPEPDELVTLSLISDDAYLIGSPNLATVVIQDDDNQPPVVSIATPTNLQFHPLIPTNIAVSVTASDPDGTIVQASLWNNTNLLGIVYGEPYDFVWNNVPSGTNSLFAVVVDNYGASATSAPIAVVVNFAPIVQLTSPTNGSSIPVGTPVNLGAFASDQDGQITNVSFYAGASLLGSVTNGPVYSLVWSNPPAGTYNLSAVAWDNWGMASTSAPVAISIAAANTNFANMFAERGFISGTNNTLTGNNATANSEPGEPSGGCGAGSRTMWVTYLATEDGYCTIDTEGTVGLDTVLNVYTNDPPNIETVTNLVSVGCDDDSGSGTLSMLTFRVRAGVAYHIRFSTYGSGSGGNFVFHQTFSSSQAPQAPTSFYGYALSGSQIYLYWTDNADNETGYILERSTNYGNTYTIVTMLPSNTVSYVDTRLTNGIYYYYRLRASNEFGLSPAVSYGSISTYLPSLSPLSVQINFGTNNCPVPQYWEADDGLPYGNRGNGYTYGWNVNNANFGRWRQSTNAPSVQYDTFQYIGQDGGGSVWEIAVSNNVYRVRVVAGDPVAYGDVYRITAEGTSVVDGTSTASQRWLEGTAYVPVSDGRLTIAGGQGAPSNRIAFVEISTALEITQQPVSTRALIGYPAQFSVSVYTDMSVAYQWYHAGTPISGATNSALVISNVQPADAGAYFVVISNAMVAVTSSVASLIIAQITEETFFITSLTTNDVRIIEHSGLTGLYDNGGFAISGSRVFYNGYNAIGSFNLADLGSPAAVQTNYFGLVSDLKTRKIYFLANDSTPMNRYGGTVNRLVELDGITGQPTGVSIRLSTNIASSTYYQMGLFSGYGRIVIWTEYNNHAYNISMPSGTVTDLGSVPYFTHSSTYNWYAFYGVAEYLDGSVYLAYPRDTQTISRLRVADGTISDIATFNSLGSYFQFAASPWNGRWYFHHLYTSQFTGSNSTNRNTLGYAQAAFAFMPPSNQPPSIVSQPQSLSVLPGATATFSVQAFGGEPMWYQWRLNNIVLPDATNSSLVISNVQLTQAGNYTVVISNAFGSVVSSNALLTLNYGYSTNMVQLLPYTNVWRYNQSGSDLGTTWRATNYNDSSWPSGRGVLAFEDAASITPLINTFLSLTNTSGSNIWTYYFRTYFTAPTNYPLEASIELVASNLVDDGAVFYVNGVESGRIRMPTGYVYYNTAASNVGDASWGLLTLTNTVFSRGSSNNLLAVEVHQSSLESSDIVFGMALFARIATTRIPPIITNQPASLDSLPGYTGTLSVGALGSGPLYYQWRRNGTNLVGKTNASLLLLNIQLSSIGDYSVVVSNAYAAVTSAVARVTLIAPPVILAGPQSFQAPVGATAVLNVSAINGNPLLYQWLFNGMPIPGQTNSTLVLSNLTLAHSGIYAVQVANAYGSVTSSNAQLTVWGPTLAVQQWQPVQGKFTLHLNGPNGVYSVFISTNLQSWQLLSTITNTTGQAELEDYSILSNRLRYYRLRLEP